MWTPWALFPGDEGLGRRYEADTSYGLLGSRHKNSDHRACPWARIVVRWYLAMDIGRGGFRGGTSRCSCGFIHHTNRYGGELPF
jgi:hypothetical protein